MLTNIRNVIEKYRMIRASDCAHPRIIVALSGGADSVCLLYVLRELNYTVEACHVNHKLRGEASDNDERFVRELCKKLGITLHVREIDVKSLQKKHQSLEEAAREARYSYFKEFGTNAIIATAHTANDNTETVLLNLTRGTGLRGLCGIPPVRENVIRPLIETTRAEIIAYLEEKGADFITDETNFSDEFTRNNLRLNIIPLLEKINPSLNTGVTRMCESLRLDEEYLHEIALNSDSCDVNLFLNHPPAIQSRIISLLLSKNNISPSNLRIKNIISLLKTGGKINLSKDKFAIVKDNLLSIETIPQNYRKN
ncbi:MAG: tRNA lysidine(34) synthetase TilS [Oscillospiraceae bacterium]|nr:tRNA lysidine(34) synthetase TilS [Oscillospiraceae bacterium]